MFLINMYKQKLYDSMVQVLTCEFAVVGMMGCDSEALLQAVRFENMGER
jgi:hypothetical protein